MNTEGFQSLIFEALETELGGVRVYETALRCAVNDELKEEWEKYLQQTERHVEIVQNLMKSLGLEADEETSGRKICRLKAVALVDAMETALQGGDKEQAQVVAAECVIDAETKDHMNWELIGEISKQAEPEEAAALQRAFDAVEEEEDEHLYHTIGWARELWLEKMGLPAVIPPPEERQRVETAIAAARAKRQRSKMVKGGRRSRRTVKTKAKVTAK
ncbi:MAG: hypothetical protein HY925_01735 [Elusimicrobia bacterium]|nr:hypothetical protein [Elusimicrobiota bacterium]